MMHFAYMINGMIQPLRCVANAYFSPILDLIIRLYVANLFFKSGWLKLESALNGQWDRSVMLFEDIHPVPGIPAEIAAVMGTGSELIFSTFLGLGLFGRLGAAGLLIMTLIIQFGVPAEYEIANPDHYFWMMLLGVILVKGPGKISVDALIMKMLAKKA